MYDKEKVKSWIATPTEQLLYNIMILLESIDSKLSANPEKATETIEKTVDTIKKMGRKPIEKVG